MSMLDLAAFRATPLNRDPFDYLILPRFIKAEALTALNADYPRIERPGSFPLSEVRYGPAFAALIEELKGAEVRAAFEQKYEVDLKDRPVMITVRGRCWEKDGNIHTDSASKILTVLIYMNPTWEEAGGRLRLLRSATDLEDVIAEVPPEEGTLVTFRRSENSWHGHKPFVGPRRVIQLNWVTGRDVLRFETTRHRVSAFFKRILKAG
ncbi:MAG: 2OG-Fe(II) oxygenase [Isosphaeraceae bacterium]|nr:2OG-Fe(II) oxygenase [Isosphaeraceae bacterium]